MARKIVVKGGPGAGKTTLAVELADRLSLTFIELDALFWGPNWSTPTAGEFRTRVQDALDVASNGWVVDGSYDSKLGDLVIGQADAVVWLDLPLIVKLGRLWSRTLRRIRGDETLWAGNKETWRGVFFSQDSLLVWAVKVHVRHRREWPRRFEGDPRLVRLRSDREIQEWLALQAASRPELAGIRS